MNHEEMITAIEKNQGMSRRGALKLMALSPVAAASILAGSGSATPSEAAASNATGKILIVGGGAGALMVLARLRRALNNPNITIIAPNEKHIYQPGQIFVAAGEYAPEDIIFDNTGYIGEDVTWIKDTVETFDPDNNKVTTKKGTIVEYDYLVVAAGIEYRYEAIEGLSAEVLGTKGIASVYQSDLSAGSAEGDGSRGSGSTLSKRLQKQQNRVSCVHSPPLRSNAAAHRKKSSILPMISSNETN
jgi:sulfide:quinone oxidoreductase